jgi:transposase
MKLAERIKVQNLYESGIKNPKVISKSVDLSIRQVYRIIERIECGEGVNPRPIRGRPRKLKTNDQKRISNLADSHPKYSTARIAKIARDRGSPAVHLTTVWRHLRRRGYIKLVPKPIPIMTAAHRQKRLQWCL